MTIVNELNQHGAQLKLRLDLSEFMAEFDQLSSLRTRLLGRLRASGLTVWAALHHLLKQCYSRLRSYRTLRDMPAEPSSPQSTTGSLRLHPHMGHHARQQAAAREPSSASNSLHRAQSSARQKNKLIADMRSYYSAALAQFNRWLALESHILFYYCAVSFRKTADEQCNTEQQSKSSETSTTPVMQPSRVLKFTIRRCEVGVWFEILHCALLVFL